VVAEAEPEAAVVADDAGKQNEVFSSSHRVACVAELGGYHFNLKELSMPIDQ